MNSSKFARLGAVAVVLTFAAQMAFAAGTTTPPPTTPTTPSSGGMKAASDSRDQNNTASGAYDMSQMLTTVARMMGLPVPPSTR